MWMHCQRVSAFRKRAPMCQHGTLSMTRTRSMLHPPFLLPHDCSVARCNYSCLPMDKGLKRNSTERGHPLILRTCLIWKRTTTSRCVGVDSELSQ